jgi:hypothetical protein
LSRAAGEQEDGPWKAHRQLRKRAGTHKEEELAGTDQIEIRQEGRRLLAQRDEKRAVTKRKPEKL